MKRLFAIVCLSILAKTNFAFALSEATLVFPLLSSRVSSAYGLRIHPLYHMAAHHNGVDIAAASGTLVRAISDGVVVFSGSYLGYGNLVVIRHNGAFSSHYGHLKAIYVNVGETLSAGSVIGTVGATGNVTGPHLHLEVRVNGAPIDPAIIFGQIDSPSKG